MDQRHHDPLAEAICALTCELHEWRTANIATKDDLLGMERRLLADLGGGGSDEQARLLREHAQRLTDIAPTPPPTT
jgi:hypothetical protein